MIIYLRDAAFSFGISLYPAYPSGAGWEKLDGKHANNPAKTHK